MAVGACPRSRLAEKRRSTLGGARDWAAAERCAGRLDLPTTCLIDVALVEDGWCLLEGNAAWGAGLNGCDLRYRQLARQR